MTKTPSLFERMTPKTKHLFETAEKIYPSHSKEVKYDLCNKIYVNDITLNTAFYLCSFILNTSLDYNNIAESFEPIIKGTIK